MEAKFTPGPWILATLPTSVGSCHKIGPFPSAGDRPYTYACVYADGIRPGIDDEIPAAIELRANARLIAAAPDLLAAAKLGLEEAESLISSDYEGTQGYAPMMAALEPIRIAIAKATGSVA